MCTFDQYKRIEPGYKVTEESQEQTTTIVCSAFSRAHTNGETCAQRTNVCRIYES